MNGNKPLLQRLLYEGNAYFYLCQWSNELQTNYKRVLIILSMALCQHGYFYLTNQDDSDCLANLQDASDFDKLQVRKISISKLASSRCSVSQGAAQRTMHEKICVDKICQNWPITGYTRSWYTRTTFCWVCLQAFFLFLTLCFFYFSCAFFCAAPWLAERLEKAKTCSFIEQET